MTLIASGAVAHAEIVALAEEKFAGLQPGGAAPTPPAHYVGGDIRDDRGSGTGAYRLCLSRRLPAPIPIIYVGADLRHGAGRRHVLAPVPGSAREARPLLFDLCLLQRLPGYRLSSASMPAPAKAEAGEISAVIAGEMEAIAGDLSDAEVARAKAQLKVGPADGPGAARHAAPNRSPARLFALGRVQIGGRNRRPARCDRCRRGEALRRAGDAGGQSLHRRDRPGRQAGIATTLSRAASAPRACGRGGIMVKARIRQDPPDGLHARPDLSRRPAAGHPGPGRLSALSAHRRLSRLGAAARREPRIPHALGAGLGRRRTDTRRLPPPHQALSEGNAAGFGLCLLRLPQERRRADGRLHACPMCGAASRNAAPWAIGSARASPARAT